MGQMELFKLLVRIVIRCNLNYTAVCKLFLLDWKTC